MKKGLILLAVSIICSTVSWAGNSKKQEAETDAFHYDIEYVKTVSDGIASVKVWSYAQKKPEIALKQCRKNAVHGVIFKGYTGPGSSHPALAKSPTALQDFSDYFDSFFGDNGEWQRYISSSDASSAETILIGKKQYKVGLVVQVNVKALRKTLEQAGVIKGLSSGF